jgi:flavin reductase
MPRSDRIAPADEIAVQASMTSGDDARSYAGLRRILGMFATGVVVVTAIGDSPMGMTANAFTSVSLEPPLALACVSHRADIHQAILEQQYFVISMLGAHQEQVARYFADHARPRGSAEFDGIRWEPAPRTGGPIVLGSLAWIECGLAEVYDGGDHSIFLGSVLNMGRGPACDALVFFGGDYRRLETRKGQHRSLDL